jgi:pimeloyl-ACP methyl ester carboxylesterase
MKMVHQGGCSSEAEMSSQIDSRLRRGSVETIRHRTAWLEAGPEQGPLVIFLHGWPELGLIWRFAAPAFFRGGLALCRPRYARLRKFIEAALDIRV